MPMSTESGFGASDIPASGVMTDYLLPLRQNVKAKLSVPSDLTPDEAKKIMKFIREFLL